jgi:proteic killer suppression protein
VIRGFRDQTTEDIYHGKNTRAARNVPVDVWPRARRALDHLNVAQHLRQLSAFPGYNLERLKGHLKDRWSVRINRQYRIVFKYDEALSAATEVEISKHYE